jgi:hypothetical protein
MEEIDKFLDNINIYKWCNGIKEFSKDIYDKEYESDDYYIEEKYMMFTNDFIRYWNSISNDKKKLLYEVVNKGKEEINISKESNIYKYKITLDSDTEDD